MQGTQFIGIGLVALCASALAASPESAMERFFPQDVLAPDGPLRNTDPPANGLYLPGSGSSLSRDAGLACQGLEGAAQQGDAQAQLSLGTCYENANGVPRNLPLALQWYEKAALQGLPDAQRLLGILYLNGAAGPGRESMGMPWLRQAATQGDPFAKTLLDFHAGQWQLRATEAVRICHQKALAIWDDGHSASATVVAQVQAACASEIDAWIEAHFPQWVAHSLQSLRQGVQEAQRSDVASQVAKLRTAR